MFETCKRARWFSSLGICDSVPLVISRKVGKAIRDAVRDAVKASGVKIHMEGRPLRDSTGQTFCRVSGIKKDGYGFALVFISENEQLTPSDKMMIHAQLECSTQLSSKGNKLHVAHAYMPCMVNGYRMEVFETDEVGASIADEMLKEIRTTEMPEKLETEQCETCHYRHLCSGDELPAVKCGSCANHEGGGKCSVPCAGFSQHIYHPQFLINSGEEMVCADQERRIIEFGGFVHSADKVRGEKPCMTSRELKQLWHTKTQNDENIIAMVKLFSAEVTNVEPEQ
ncbi:MAG: hypothetical protein R3183_06860 [Oleiphilaceae bacterium]|nr:hypothetical protein [Oleiphilaceae bacterium]